VHDDRDITARTIQMRLDDLQRKRGGDTGVEGIAALFQRRHPDRGGDPVGRSHDPESAFDFRPGGEWIGVDLAHGNPSLR
jgi:hypothetical protein